MKTTEDIINEAYRLGFKAGSYIFLLVCILIGAVLAICLIHFLG
jgi:hypothetical protein